MRFVCGGLGLFWECLVSDVELDFASHVTCFGEPNLVLGLGTSKATGYTDVSHNLMADAQDLLSVIVLNCFILHFKL